MAEEWTSGCPSTDDCLFLILFGSCLLSSTLKQGMQNVPRKFFKQLTQFVKSGPLIGGLTAEHMAQLVSVLNTNRKLKILDLPLLPPLTIVLIINKIMIYLF